MRNFISCEQKRHWQHIAKVFAVSSSGVFFLVFFGSMIAGLFLQLVVLPALPSLNAGNGLLKGGDWVRFHHEAVELVSLMGGHGWHAWELRPQGNAPIGIAAAAYFITGISEPWVLLPINAAIFALAAVSLYGIFKSLASKHLALIATLPFVLFPSSVMIYGQIHKDVFSIAGTLLITYVWVRFAQRTQPDWRSSMGRVLFTAIGCSLVWIVRPYLLQSLIVASLLIVLLLGVVTVRGRGAVWWVSIILCLFVQVSYSKLPSGTASNTTNTTNTTNTSITSITSITSNYLERSVAHLNATRVGFAESSPNAGSNIDTSVQFGSIVDVLSYVPRALQVGLFAPFPSKWFSDGVSPGSGIMRYISGLEMAVSYMLFIGVVLLLYGLKDHRPALLVIIIMVMVMTVVLTLVVCNVGTLYRMRYGSWHLLHGLGVLGWGQYWEQWFSKKHSDFPPNLADS